MSTPWMHGRIGLARMMIGHSKSYLPQFINNTHCLIIIVLSLEILLQAEKTSAGLIPKRSFTAHENYSIIAIMHTGSFMQRCVTN